MSDSFRQEVNRIMGLALCGEEVERTYGRKKNGQEFALVITKVSFNTSRFGQDKRSFL